MGKSLFLRRSGAFIARWRERFPLTNLGLLVMVLSVSTFLLFGVPRVDYVVQLVCVLAVVLVLGALAVVVYGAITTHRVLKSRTGGQDREGQKQKTSEAITFEAVRGFASVLRMPARWLPMLEISWEWESPEGFVVERITSDGQITERVESSGRAHVEVIVRRFIIEDGFGLARIVLRRTEQRPVRVFPWLGQLERAPLVQSLLDGDQLPHPAGNNTGDRVDMRRYVTGDPLRLILWKVYARTRELMVRTPETAIAPAVRVVAYLPAAKGDEPAAAAALVAVDAGVLGQDWQFSTDGADRVVSDAAEAKDLILRSKNVRGTDLADAAGLDAFIQNVSDKTPARIVLFIPSVPGPWLERCAAVIKKHPGHTSCVIVTDGVAAAESKSRIARLVKVQEEEDLARDGATTPDAIAEVVETLATAGAEIVAVDRPSGRMLTFGSRPHMQKARVA